MNPLNVLIRLVDKTEIFIVLFWGNNLPLENSPVIQLAGALRRPVIAVAVARSAMATGAR
jgi:hypothetical protein